MVIILGFHPGDPGSSPGWGATFLQFLSQSNHVPNSKIENPVDIDIGLLFDASVARQLIDNSAGTAFLLRLSGLLRV